MKLAGYQPQYFPRLHYMNRVLTADVFEVSDYVQFVKKHAYDLPTGEKKRGKSYQAHTVVKLDTGAFFLALPASDDMRPINKTPLDYTKRWNEKHIKTLEVAFRKSPFFSTFFPEIESLLSHEYASLSELNMQTILWSITRILTDDVINKDSLSLTTVNNLLKSSHPFRLKNIFLASETTIPAPEKGGANEWIIALCKYAHADEYAYGGTSHSAYMDLETFKKNGVQPVLQEWTCAPYPQQYSKLGFIPNLSILDLIFNADLQSRQKILL